MSSHSNGSFCVGLAFPDGEGAYISSKQICFGFFHFTSQAAPNGGKCPKGERGAVSKKGRIGLIIHWALKSKKVPTSEARFCGSTRLPRRGRGTASRWIELITDKR